MGGAAYITARPLPNSFLLSICLSPPSNPSVSLSVNFHHSINLSISLSIYRSLNLCYSLHANRKSGRHIDCKLSMSVQLCDYEAVIGARRIVTSENSLYSPLSLSRKGSLILFFFILHLVMQSFPVSLRLHSSFSLLRKLFLLLFPFLSWFLLLVFALLLFLLHLVMQTFHDSVCLSSPLSLILFSFLFWFLLLVFE